MGGRRASARFLAAIAAAALGLGPGVPAQAGGPPRLLVAPPQVDPGLAPLARGHRAWLESRLASAGIPLVPAPPQTATLEAALSAGSGSADLVVQADLREREGRARVALRALDPGSRSVAESALAEAALPELGVASEEALAALLPHFGIPAGALPETTPPGLDELAAVGRALEALDRGELSSAWLEVQGRLAPMAMQLRESILEQAQRTGVPPAERARVLAAAGDGEGAWRLLAPALEKAGSQSDPRLLVAAAEAQIARRNPAQARELAEAALRLRPEDPDALLALGRALELAGDAAAARTALERAARAAPRSPRAIEQLAALEASRPAEGARRLLSLAALEAERLEPERAVRSLARAALLDPRAKGPAARARAQIAARMGRSEEALRAYEEALRSASPRDPEVLAGVGLARLRTGKGEAEEPLRLAIELAPGHPQALRGLAELEARRGRTAEATALLERAVAADPENETGRVALARALAAIRGPEAGLETLTGAGAPAPVEPETLGAIANLQREAGHPGAARATLERALASWPEASGLRSLLGEVSRSSSGTALDLELANGDGAATPLAFDAIVFAFAAQVKDPRARRVAFLGVREPRGGRAELLRWLHPRRPDHERLAGSLGHWLGMAFAHVPADAPASPVFGALVDQLFDFDRDGSLDAEAIAQVNQTLGSDAIFAARLLRAPADFERGDGTLAACAAASGFAVELRMLSGRHADVASILTEQTCIPDGLELASAWNRRALPIYALLALVLLYPILRGWGTLVVAIKLPPRTRGFLSIRIGHKPEPAESGKQRRPKRDAGRLRRSLRSLSRFRKQMAGRETLFRWIPARKRAYFVTVRGPLLDAMGEQVIGHFLEEQRVRVERGRIARLVYDYCPNECAVEVKVLRDGAPAKGARAALRGDPASIRYPRGGTAYFYLGVGTHTIVVGAGDRAAEQVVRIGATLNAIPVAIDLGNPDACMIRNCAEAVEPYLLGDFVAAARALEMVGEAVSAHLMWGAHHQQQGDPAQAATAYEAAGYFEAAAELRASHRDLAGSAALFEQAGDFARAAETHRAGGALVDAARCYEQAYDYQEAIECYREAGAREQALDLMEKIGAYMDAADLAREIGNPERAIRSLHHVDRRDATWAEACRKMAEILAERGQHDLAAQKIAEAIDAIGGGAATVELHALHADLLERATRPREAIEALEELRRLDPTRAGLVERIAALAGPAAPPAPAAPAGPAAPEAERRYEIQGELGRGGMGVVMKARDRRLGRLVALKRMPEHLRQNKAVAELFLREARAAAGLNHRNIVTVYDAGVEDGAYFISMELLDGMPLDKILERRGRLGSADTARIGIQVCDGLHYAHERRIVHRDIKTANLFFTRDKVVKIMDFGLAKTIEEVRRTSTVIGGTPYYMAPEQAAGEAVDARTDLYAFGVTCFRMLSGIFPFREGDLAYQHRHVPAPDLREVDADLPAPFAELVGELLAKDPAARPATAGAVGARLQAILRASART